MAYKQRWFSGIAMTAALAMVVAVYGRHGDVTVLAIARCAEAAAKAA